MKFVVLALFVAGGKDLSVAKNITHSTVTAICVKLCSLGIPAFSTN